jgi:AcrR family transcriptional regulator
MEAATKQRELSGEKAQRIVDAMRVSVAKRGAAGSTFEHVAREAGVSRGLLHYYFGTKERLLVEVVRRDAEIRVARLDEPLAKAETVDDVVDVLLASLTDLIENEPAFFFPRSSTRSASSSSAPAPTSPRGSAPRRGREC